MRPHAGEGRIMDLGKLLGFGSTERTHRNHGALFEGLQTILAAYSDDEVMLIAGMAGLLGHVAYADHDISEAEISGMRRILGAQLDLDTGQVDAILEILMRHRVQLFTLENHLYARMINAVAGKERRKKLLRVLFALAAADRSISTQEDTAMRLVANALKLTHNDFVTIRSEFKEHRDVFRDSP